MKFLKVKFFSLLAILSVSVLIISCEQDALIPTVDTLNVNNTTPPMIEDFETEKPLLHLGFDGDMTSDEVDEQARKVVNDYISSLDTEQLEDRNASNEWYSVVKIRTGSQAGSSTALKRVRIRLNFDTDICRPTYKSHALPYYIKDKWNVYLIRHTFPNQGVKWVEAKWVELGHQGMDDWLVTDIEVHVIPKYQSTRSSGQTYIFSRPFVWLDSDHPSGWDFYTAHGGYGRLNF